MYTIDEGFEILLKDKLTSHKETVRNWVRKGAIQAEPLESRKKVYWISEEALEQFRRPDGWELYPEQVTENVRGVVKNEEEREYFTETDVEATKEWGRIEMQHQVAGRWLWEGDFEISRMMVCNTVAHGRYSKEFEQLVWERCLMDSAPLKKHAFFTWLMRSYLKKSWYRFIRILI